MEYVDANGFEPLPAYLERALTALLEDDFLAHEDAAVADELKGLGYLSDARYYMDGTGIAEVAPRGLHYFEEKAAWEARVAEWRKEGEERERDGKRHDWKLSIANGAYMIVGVVLGFLLGKVF